MCFANPLIQFSFYHKLDNCKDWLNWWSSFAFRLGGPSLAMADWVVSIPWTHSLWFVELELERKDYSQLGQLEGEKMLIGRKIDWTKKFLWHKFFLDPKYFAIHNNFRPYKCFSTQKDFDSTFVMMQNNLDIKSSPKLISDATQTNMHLRMVFGSGVGPNCI